MKTTFLFLLVFLLIGCAATSIKPENPKTDPPLPDLGAAPELTNEIWLNTPEPLRLAELRGKVVLLDMWTFG